jgi:hypothetical protein
MPESFNEATKQGLRRGWRDFLANILGQFGKIGAWVILGIAFIFLALWVVDWMWDGFMSPFRGAWSWTTGKFDGGVDWVTGWLPGGDTTVDPATVEVIEEVVTEVSDEQGIICRNTGSWNLFCK